MKTLDELIATIPADWNWLNRSDKNGGFMANVMDERFDSMDEHPVGSFPVYAQTSHDALFRAIENAKTKHGLFWDDDII